MSDFVLSGNIISDTLTISGGSSFRSMTVTGDASFRLMTLAPVTTINYITADPYEGQYVFTPTRETQIVEGQGLMLTQNITINPIPSNYGLVTWNGSTLTVS